MSDLVLHGDWTVVGNFKAKTCCCRGKSYHTLKSFDCTITIDLCVWVCVCGPGES